MSFYFLKEVARGRQNGTFINESFELPIKIDKSQWTHLEKPNRISKIFQFDQSPQSRHFLTQLLDLVDTSRHPIKIVIEDLDVSIELYTREIDDVTETDLEIARFCDELFEESLYIVS